VDDRFYLDDHPLWQHGAFRVITQRAKLTGVQIGAPHRSPLGDVD